MRIPNAPSWLCLILIGACLPNFGCTLDECGDAVYPVPDDPQPGDRSAKRTESGWFGFKTVTYFDFSPVFLPERDFAVRDVKAGDGALATSYRRMTFEVTVRDQHGDRPADRHRRRHGDRRTPAKLSFIYPSPGEGIGRFGDVPERFLAAVAGMRVGGERDFTLEPDMQPLTAKNEPAGRLLFLDESRRVVMDLPGGEPWRFHVRLLAVCKPTICTTTTYSVPAMTNKGMLVLSCD